MITRIKRVVSSLIAMAVCSAVMLNVSAFAAEEQIDDSWFDDALFVGDSLTALLCTETAAYGELGDAAVIYRLGISCYEMMVNGWGVSCVGKTMSVADCAEFLGAGKLFLLLGMNDLWYDCETMETLWRQLIDDIREKNPGIEIYIQSVTPLYKPYDGRTNEKINELNDMLIDVCRDNECTYVDIASGLKDEAGLLKAEYHVDEMHFNHDGCLVWIDELRNPENYYSFSEEDDDVQK